MRDGTDCACLLPTGTYNLSGGETLPYREMVCRVFAGSVKCHAW